MAKQINLSTSPPNQIGTIEFPINKEVNGYQQYHSSPYTRVELSP